MVKYFFLLFLLFNNLGFCQDFYFESYSIDEGLPTSNVYSIFEDSTGYLWFATDTGVLLFDGYDFINYTTDNGLADNEIFRIFQDREERLWFFSLNGKLSFFKDGQFYNYETTDFLKKASQDEMVVDITQDDDGEIYVLFRSGIISMINKNQVQTSKVESKSSFALWKYENEKLIANSKEIRSLTKDSIILKHNIPSKAFIRYVKVKEDEFYYSVENKIYLFKKGASKFLMNVGETEIINLSIIEDDLFIGTRNGLYIKSTNKVSHYFKGEQISCTLKDSQGNLWLSTLDNGIKFIPNQNIKNQVFNSKNKTINSLFPDEKGNLWFGAFDALYTKGENEVTTKVLNDNVFGFRQIDDVIFIFSEQLFISSKNQLIKIPIRINDIIKTDTHYVFATSSYISKITHKEFNHLKSNPLVFEKTLMKNIVFKKRVNFLNQQQGIIYVGTSNGLYYMQEEALIKISSKNKALESSIVSVFYDDDNKVSLIATRSNGIILLKNNKVQQQLKISDNLNSNSCNKIVKIDNNVYLVATNKGLNMITIKTEIVKVENINPVLGIKDLIVNDVEIVDGVIHVASSKGLLSFNKSILNMRSNHKPKLLLNKICVNGRESKDLNQLNYTQNNITFEFTGLSFSSYGDVIYEYRLNEDLTWLETKTRTIVFNSLQPEEYTLSIRAKGTNDLLSETKTIHFKIRPPIWKRPIFVVLSSTLCLGLIVLFFKQRIDKQNIHFKLERETLKNKQEKLLLEKETAELEQKALRLQMNPHFIFNALNTIKGYYSIGDIKEANSYINKFSKLLRLILENQSKVITLEKEVEMLQLYLKLVQLRYQNIFDFSINISNEIDIDNTGIPPLLLQPIVENAIIHGIAPNANNKGVLEISFSFKNEKLVCRVVDNGIGFIRSKKNKNKMHDSKAIKITQERIELMNNSKSSNNFEMNQLNNPTGTEVLIYLPIIKLW